MIYFLPFEVFILYTFMVVYDVLIYFVVGASKRRTYRYKSYIIILLKYFKWCVQVEMVYEQTVEREQVINFEGVNKSNASNITLRAKFLFEQYTYCMWDVKILWVPEQSKYLRCVDAKVLEQKEAESLHNWKCVL